MATTCAATGRCRARSATARRRKARSRRTPKATSATRAGGASRASQATCSRRACKAWCAPTTSTTRPTAADEAGEFVYGNDGRNGIGPDLAGDLNRGANRYALALGLKYAYDLSTTFKIEYRLDGADRAVFEDVNDGSFKKNNSLLAASIVVAF